MYPIHFSTVREAIDIKTINIRHIYLFTTYVLRIVFNDLMI